MIQSFRIAVKRIGHDSTHYVIRDEVDLDNILSMINAMLTDPWYDDIEYIKWVPIPALEEV